MGALFLRVLSAACVVSVLLAVLLFPARQWMLRRYAAQMRWTLWRGLAGLLLFGICFSGFAAVPETVWEVPDYAITLPVKPASVPETQLPPERTLSAAPEPSASVSESPEDVPAQEASSSAPGTLEKRSLPLTALAGTFWLAGTVSVIFWQCGRYGRMRKRLLAASASTNAFDDAIREAGVRASVRVLPGSTCPVTLGIFRPVVLLPGEQVPFLAVRHELTHIKRHDLAGKTLLFLACAFYWFDPLVWRMARVAGEDMEAACDAQLTREMTSAEKRAYGELLLKAATDPGDLPLCTRFGGSGEQMRARLTQLFHPGRAGRTLAGAILCGAFLVVGLVACESGGSGALAVDEAVLYASIDLARQPEDTDYSELTLDLVDFSPGADWVGGSYDTVTIPVAEGVLLSGSPVSVDNREKDLYSFLAWPLLRSYALPGSADVLRVEVRDGAITAMDWYEGMTDVGGVLWQDEDYGGAFPYVLRLPESWRNGFDTVAALSRNGQKAVTGYSVEFYRKGTQDLLFTLECQAESDVRSRYGDDDAALRERGIWMLDRVDGWRFYAELEQDAASEDGLIKDLLTQGSENFFAWLGPECYTNTRYGFTLDLPDSWQGHYHADETLQGLEFSYGGQLCSLYILTEPLSQEMCGTDQAQFLGSGNGWYVYILTPQSDAAAEYEDPAMRAEQIRRKLMCRDLADLLESGTWGPVFAQGEDAVYPELPPAAEPEAETRAAFVRVLRDLWERGILPDGRTIPEPEYSTGGSGCFAVADVDADGKEELILYDVTAEKRGYIIGYDEARGQIQIQLEEYPCMEFYGSGAVKAMFSHNHSLGELWPYTLYTYLPETDSYRQEAMVMAWDKSFSTANDAGQPFPDGADRSGTGTVYYVEQPDGWYESDPMDQMDYVAWEAEALEQSQRLTLRFLPLTEENIMALEN